MGSFKKIDESFECANCGKMVPKLNYTSRNHCNNCLYSIHLDDTPGDRASDCRGLMRPIGIDYSAKKGYIIVHKCEKCGAIKRNKAASDDNMSLIIKLSSGETKI